MHFVLLLIHSSKVKYKIPNLHRPKKILMDSGKFLRNGLYVTLSQPVMNTSPLSRTVRDGMESMLYKYFIFDCSVCHFHYFKAMHTLELQVFSELLFMRTVCEGSWTCLDKGNKIETKDKI